MLTPDQPEYHAGDGKFARIGVGGGDVGVFISMELPR